MDWYLYLLWSCLAVLSVSAWRILLRLRHSSDQVDRERYLRWLAAHLVIGVAVVYSIALYPYWESVPLAGRMVPLVLGLVGAWLLARAERGSLSRFFGL